MFLVDSIRDFGSLSEEIKVLADWLLAQSSWFITAKCIVVEVITGLVQLIT